MMTTGMSSGLIRGLTILLVVTAVIMHCCGGSLMVLVAVMHGVPGVGIGAD
jgi:hypothetical protein